MFYTSILERWKDRPEGRREPGRTSPLGKPAPLPGQAHYRDAPAIYRNLIHRIGIIWIQNQVALLVVVPNIRIMS